LSLLASNLSPQACLTKYSAEKDLATAQVERATSLVDSMSEQEKRAVEKFLATQAARLPLLRAFNWIPDVSNITKGLPSEWTTLGEQEKQQWESAYEGWKMVDELKLKYGDDVQDHWPSEWATIKEKLLALDTLKNPGAVDHQIWQVFFEASFQDQDGNLIAIMHGEFLDALEGFCSCCLMRLFWQHTVTPFMASNSGSMPVKNLKAIVPAGILHVHCELLYATSLQALKDKEKARTDDIEAAKEFVDRTKSVISASQKALQAYQGD